ncbi:Methyltransferase domain-containing protein [Reichenbachiella faecimaris]|uniref:Methyltransferase domain-containing protein n=1 Tax=Reichenbachiella faecimaris TaxID=692418 RepID=A0A1W2G6L8_REIFA|nr:class I SAM-dependent methyltransferase [Reichenbachiella faecimaris]SMD32251.1 Methyltransferase domain-containing protein [Reichenbachiella faecimaris]
MTYEFELNYFRGPLNAWIFKALSSYMNRLFGDSKRKLFEGHPSTVVEIGPGAGANMRYYSKGTNLIAIEPNLHMHENLHKSAYQYGINLKIRSLVGEAIDLPDNSYEFVVSTLVLCSVHDPEMVLQQIKRILKPDGKFVFIEHVKAKENTFLAWFQRLIHKPWHWFFEGCHTNRDTASILQSIGFSSLTIENYNQYSPFVAIIPQIRGRAIK